MNRSWPFTCISASPPESIAEENMAWAMPERHPILVDLRDIQIVEPVALYLASLHMRKFAESTIRTYSEDLKDWWYYLDLQGRHWLEASRFDIELFRDTLLQTISPKTKLRYSSKFIIRRLISILKFYEFANGKDWVRSNFYEENKKISIYPVYGNSQDHYSSDTTNISSLLPISKSGVDDFVNPMQPHEWRLISGFLGPLPGEAREHELTRDRLVWEWALWTGMRIHEVVGLTKWQIESLTPDHSPHKPCILLITKTKGGRERKVLPPSWLIKETLIYMKTERERALQRLSISKRKSTISLFLNSDLARNPRHSGHPLRTQTAMNSFRAAVISSGLTINQTRTDPETGKDFTSPRTLHTGHDTRHTFAVWLYHARKMAGDNEPWKLIQALLGHKSLSTTIDIYLRVVGLYEASISDMTLNAFRCIYEGSENVH